jgi:hypothetical protein
MVGVDVYWVSGSVKVVSPFPESSNDPQHFSVVNLVVLFCWVEGLGEETDWVSATV